MVFIVGGVTSTELEKQHYTEVINQNASKEGTVQQLQVSRDDLVEAIRQRIHDLMQDETCTSTLWTLLQLEYALSNLYIKEE